MLRADWKRHYCLVAYLGVHGQDCHSLPDLQTECRSSCRFSLPYFRSNTEFQLIADVDIHYRLGQFTDYNLRIVTHRNRERPVINKPATFRFWRNRFVWIHGGGRTHDRHNLRVSSAVDHMHNGRDMSSRSSTRDRPEVRSSRKFKRHFAQRGSTPFIV